MKAPTTLLLTSAVAALAQNTTNTTTLSWGPCDGLPKNESSTYQCATLPVPLDYALPLSANNTLTLNLLKFPAPKQPSKGSVLFNPGGPGDSGRTALVQANGQLAAIVSAYTAFQHDIITWDPRGTGTTLPAVCFANQASRQLVLDRIPYITSSNFDAAARTGFGVAGSLASACGVALEGTGTLLGSAYVARDMVRTWEALGEGGGLRYYGASYGTALGQIFAAMFPEKVERMVLDGVLNPHEYVAGEDYQQLASTDAVFEGFLSACLSRPTECPLAARSTSTKNLKQQFDEGLKYLESNPFSYGPSPAEYITASALEQTIIQALYAPSGWATLAANIDAVISRNVSALAAIAAAAPVPPPPPFNDQSQEESIPSIRCSDVTLRVDDVEQVLPIAKTLLDQSPQLGSYVLTAQPLLCSQWPFVAKERYTGDFNVSTRNPILFVGNVFDPITSLDAARNASATFQGSRLLVHEGYGHTSEMQLSKCTIDAVAEYFLNGTLPAEGTVCRPDVPIFASVEELVDVQKRLLLPS
ncbi:hypothetical protein PRZ48_010406 [Zasmidium cellare]|uniref:Peptidase S33 tripeptidyl aminopeptidase-like C-terminal domain-containing protein n=1 Tax=Zasmidium cellare TaxID=395010 RepID=A0ABR0E902_ZASCE|nr:hypothetical protein PRZ48_010406 [Zasmidium cellare]